MSGEGVGGLTDNDRAVICERHFGWEKASFASLAAIFGVHPNTIAAICRGRS